MSEATAMLLDRPGAEPAPRVGPSGPSRTTLAVSAVTVALVLAAQVPAARHLLHPGVEFEAARARTLLIVNAILALVTVLGAALLPARLRALALAPGATVAGAMLGGAVTLGAHLGDVGVAVLTATGAWWSGRWLLRAVGARPLQGVAVVELVVGLGALGVVVLAFGRLHLIAWWSVGLLAVAIGAAGAWSGARETWRRRGALRESIAGSRVATACLGLLLLQLGWAVVWLSAPEIMFDAIYGKAYLPQLWAATGSIDPLIKHPVLNISGLAQLVAVPGHTLGFHDVGRELQTVAWIALVGTIWWCAARSPAGPLAALLVGVVPALVWQATTAYDDLIMALGAAALAIGVLRTADRRAPGATAFGTAIGIGLLTGACVWLKLNMLALTLPLGAGWVLLARPAREVARRATGVAIGCLAIAAPVFALRWIDTGNPVFPNYNEIFHSSYYPPVNERYDFPHWPGAHLLDALTVPYRAALDPASMQESAPAGMYGMLIAALLIAAFVGWRHRRRRGAIVVWAAMLLGLAGWWVQFRYLRYILPSAAVAVVLVAVQLRDWRPRRAVTPLLLAAAAAASILYLPSTVGSYWNVPNHDLPLGAAFGRWDEQDYLRIVFPEKPVLDAFQRLAPPGANALSDAHERTFLEDRDLSPPWEVARLLQLSGPPPTTAGAALRRLDALGIRWVILNPPWQTAAILPWLTPLTSQDGRVVFSANGWNLIALRRPRAR
jgi:hypothetical protein